MKIEGVEDHWLIQINKREYLLLHLQQFVKFDFANFLLC
jgi:hypothetical protein